MNVLMPKQNGRSMHKTICSYRCIIKGNTYKPAGSAKTNPAATHPRASNLMI